MRRNLKTFATQGIEPNGGGGALSSNVSKLGSKEVRKRLRNFTFASKKACHCEDERSEDVAIAKSLNINEITTQSMIARNDKSSSETNLTTYRLNDLTSFLDMVFSRFTSHFSRKRVAFTLAEGATHVDTCDGKRKIAFTLAEVLITLGIIGVVASLTLPSVIHQYRKKALETQFKTAYSFVNQALVMTKQDLGSNSLFDDYTVYNSKQGYVYANEFKNAFYKRLKVVGNATLKSTDYSIYSDGNIKRYTSGDRFTFTTPDKLLENGMTIRASVAGNYDGSKYIQFVVDINGNKGPNRMGHDLFIFKIKDSSDKLIGSKKIRDYTEDELGDLSSGGINNLLGMPCSRYSKQSANGVGCTWYAINNICPDDETKGYWECLPR